MLDQNAREVISLKQSDLVKSHFSKAELERILRVYKICRQAQANPSMQKLYSGKLAWIAAAAQKHIKDFAEGRLSIDADAAVAMNDFVGEFGRTYKHEGNVLKYVYTSEARQARIALARTVYRQKIAAEEAKVETVRKLNRPVVDKTVSGRKVPVSRRVRQGVSGSRLKQASGQQKQKWLSKFKKSLANASLTITKETKVTGKGLKIAALTGLLAYPLLASLSKGSDTNLTGVYDNFARSSMACEEASVKDSTSRDSMNLAVAEEKYFAVNDSDFVLGLPENIFWAEYVTIKKDIESNQITDGQVVWDNDSCDGILQEEHSKTSSKKDDYPVPYSENYARVVAANDSAYREFALTLTNQFLYNIAEMKSGRNLYREKEKLIGKYYSYNHIIPNKSCESMTFATFLDVLEREQDKPNYIHEACRDLLFQVANPHGCYSNIHTFKGVSCKNLRKALSKRLQEDEYGIYMVWIPRGGGMYHRQTVIGVGNGEAYLLAFNNNRAIKMDVDNLNKISSSGGYFANLGGKIFERANNLAVDDYNKRQMQEEASHGRDYLAQVWDCRSSRRDYN